MSESSWQTVASEQQRLRDSKIPKEWILESLPADDISNVMDIPRQSGIMTEKELSITDLDATSLLEQMKSGQLKSYDVTLAFCKRAAIAQQLVSGLVQ
jgi:hypothetical protein